MANTRFELVFVDKDGVETAETVEATSYSAEVGLLTFYRAGVGPVASYRADRVVTVKRLGSEAGVRAV